MRARRPIAVGAALWLAARAAAAGDQAPGRLELGASVGVAAPLGGTERGERLRDTTFGAVPFALDAAYRIATRAGIAAHLHYGVVVPTLCPTASDCASSLGADVSAVVGARVHLPGRGPLAPIADVGVGYEWLTTRMSDAGAHSTRAHQGPVLVRLGLAAPFRFAGRWSFGPAADVSLGTFTAYALETNADSPAGRVPARALHAWVSVGARLAHDF